MILNICDITHYSITLFKNLLYKDIQLYYKSVYVMIGISNIKLSANFTQPSVIKISFT